MLKILHNRPQRATAGEKISQDLARIIASDEAKAIRDQQFLVDKAYDSFLPGSTLLNFNGYYVIEFSILKKFVC